MSEPLTDEQLAEWERETHDGDHPRSSMLWRVHALIQEVRRLREESESRYKAQHEFQRVADDYAEANRGNRERAEKAEVDLDNIWGQLIDKKASLEKAGAEVERLRHSEAVVSNDAMRWDEEMKALEAERDDLQGERASLREEARVLFKNGMEVIAERNRYKAVVDAAREEHRPPNPDEACAICDALAALDHGGNHPSTKPPPFP